MTRRHLFTALAAAVAAPALLDPEKLLWVRGAKMISIPKAIFVPQKIWVGDYLLIDGRIHTAIETVVESECIDMRIRIHPPIWSSLPPHTIAAALWPYSSNVILMSDAIRARKALADSPVARAAILQSWGWSEAAAKVLREQCRGPWCEPWVASNLIQSSPRAHRF